MARDRWKSQTIFLFAAIGSAVGLGNLWRFPFLAYEYGGGAFLIPYLLALLIIGMPLLLLEFALGQKMQKGAPHSFKSINDRLSGIGYGALLASFLVVVYYAAVMAWSFVYLVKSFALQVPWAGNAEGYFFSDVLNISSGVGAISGINIPLLLGLAATWLCIYLIVRNGVHSVGKVVAWTVPLPIILLVVLFIRGITLPGALDGILLYITPDFTALFDPQIWIAAVSQIFFTLSLAFGIMIAYASFNKQTQDVRNNALVTAWSNSLISIFAGFVVFSILGFMAFSNNVAPADVVTSGPGLAFVAFPEAISLMPLAPLFAVLFFIVLLSLGIDSAFSLVEAVNTAITDKFNVAKNTVAAVVTLVAFLLGLLFVTDAGLYFLDIVDHFVTNFALVTIGLFQCIAVGWVYGADKMRAYINKVSGANISPLWDIAIKFVIPIILVVLLALQFLKELEGNYGGYPDWAIAIGWISAIVPVLLVVAMAFITDKKKPVKN